MKEIIIKGRNGVSTSSFSKYFLIYDFLTPSMEYKNSMRIYKDGSELGLIINFEKKVNIIDFSFIIRKVISGGINIEEELDESLSDEFIYYLINDIQNRLAVEKINFEDFTKNIYLNYNQVSIKELSLFFDKNVDFVKFIYFKKDELDNFTQQSFEFGIEKDNFKRNIFAISDLITMEKNSLLFMEIPIADNNLSYDFVIKLMLKK